MPKTVGLALPTESPLSMPRQPLHANRIRLRQPRTIWARLSLYLVRLIVLGASLGLSAAGIYEMWSLMQGGGGLVVLQWVFLVLFGINFTWISLSGIQSLVGFLRRMILDLRSGKTDPTVLSGRIAVLMPVYNEDPHHVAASLEAMAAGLARLSPGHFDLFILSDTTRPDAWILEEKVFYALIQKMSPDCPIYYRHRAQNVERKAGNIADWVQRWGGAYASMIVLDADSVMDAEVMLTLARRLEAAPGVGLIQTLPTIVNARSVYGRLQQFANACYGPIFGNGLAAWHGLSSNFWGHNAIIRVQAFADSAKLPILSGKPPFGGQVLSHDFIEAGLLRRAGWGVRLDTDLQASYEEAPPALSDVLVRDRRWCQGNFQHARLLMAKGLSFPTRLHLLTGIMAYLSAVFWFLLVIVGLTIAVQAALTEPNYFGSPSLFPHWPVFDTERAIQLFVLSMVILLAPKALGWLSNLIHLRRCRQFGGPIRLTLGVITEMLLSALFAPIMMLGQTRIVQQILMGEDSGWSPQRRQDGSLRFVDALRLHYWKVIFGVAMSILAQVLNPELFWWMLPVNGGLVLAPWLSMFSGSVSAGMGLKKVGLLLTPEERAKPEILERLGRHHRHHARLALKPALQRVVNSPRFLRWHCTQLPRRTTPRSEFNPGLILAKAKMENSRSLAELEPWLTTEEMMALLNDGVLLRSLGRSRSPGGGDRGEAFTWDPHEIKGQAV